MPLPSDTWQEFTLRRCSDGTFDAICMKCYLTAGTIRRESDPRRNQADTRVSPIGAVESDLRESSFWDVISFSPICTTLGLPAALLSASGYAALLLQ